MKREILNDESINEYALKAITNFHTDIVEEVKTAVNSNKIVVVGMAQNPVVKKAISLLNEKNLEYKFLSYGSYLSMWRKRLAIKLWSGWPTFPQIFIDGKLIGGYVDLLKYFKHNQKSE